MINDKLETLDFSKMTDLDILESTSYLQNTGKICSSAAPFRMGLTILSNISENEEYVCADQRGIITNYTWVSTRNKATEYDIVLLRKCGWFLINSVWCY